LVGLIEFDSSRNFRYHFIALNRYNQSTDINSRLVNTLLSAIKLHRVSNNFTFRHTFISLSMLDQFLLSLVNQSTDIRLSYIYLVLYAAWKKWESRANSSPPFLGEKNLMRLYWLFWMLTFILSVYTYMRLWGLNEQLYLVYASIAFN